MYIANRIATRDNFRHKLLELGSIDFSKAARREEYESGPRAARGIPSLQPNHTGKKVLVEKTGCCKFRLPEETCRRHLINY